MILMRIVFFSMKNLYAKVLSMSHGLHFQEYLIMLIDLKGCNDLKVLSNIY
jgi:hypothetical protein